MNKLLINILNGCFLNTIASPQMIEAALYSLTMNKMEFSTKQISNQLIVNSNDVMLIFNISKTGYITEIKVN